MSTLIKPVWTTGLFPDPATTYALDVTERRIVAGPHVRDACKRHLEDLKRDDIYFDLEDAYRVWSFFTKQLHLSDGQFDGKPFILHPSQEFILLSIFGWKRRRDDLRRFQRAYIEQGKGNGKALAIDTPIATPDGWKSIGELQIGDHVFDEHGIPCNVIATTGIMQNRKCYRMKFSDGTEMIADAEHLWLTSALRTGLTKGPKSDECPRKGQPFIRTTEEISRTLMIKESSSMHPQAKWNHRIDIAGALDLPKVDLPIPPYTFGIWLGDGDSDCARITVGYSDFEIVKFIREDGVNATERKRHSETTARVLLGEGSRLQKDRNTSVQSKLRSLTVLGNKHIPMLYMRASYDQRIEVLRGLLDSDGTIAKNGQIELTLTSERLANDSVELIASLGFKPTIHESNAMLEGRCVGSRYRIQFWAYNDTPVFKLKRKFDRQRERPNTRSLSQGRMIVGCDEVASVPVCCISVDSPSNMYLAGKTLIPTHNSPFAAGIGLYGMFADREPGAQVYSAASTKGQADILFQDAVKMSQTNPKMKERITYSGKSNIWNMAVLGIPQAASFFRPVARTVSKRGSGPRPHFVLVDELHELADRGVLETLERGFKWRRQPLILMITNSGHDRKSVCWEERKLAVRAARGERVADEVFSYICALDKGDDPLEDPSCWVKANPLLGTILTEDYLASVVSNAQTMPSKLNGILRLHFCVWTESEDAWITRAAWEAIEDPDLTIEAMRGRACRAGMDLSSRKDLTAVAYAFDDGLLWDEDEEKFKKKLAVIIDAYTPEVGLPQRSKTDGAPYDVWVREGFLKTTPGPVIRFPFIIRDLVAMQDHCDLQSVAYDEHLIVRFKEDMEEAGADLPLIEHPQGWNRRRENPLWMPGSIDLTEDMILEGRLRVHVNPVLRAAVSGATFIRSPADLKRFSKSDATQRIDALIALVQAVGAWHIDEAASEESVYEALARKATEKERAPVVEADRFDEWDD